MRACWLWRIFAGMAILLPLCWGLKGQSCGLAGETVFIIKPVVAAMYDEGGKPARDDEILYGMTAVVTGDADGQGLLPMRTEYGYDVRVHNDDVLFQPDIAEAWLNSHTHVVAGLFADVFSEPDFKSWPPALVLPRGAKLWVESVNGDYAEVRLHDGSAGYIRLPLIREKRFWEDVEEIEKRRNIVEDGMAYLGVPYRWGGKTANGIDCSGLAAMTYMMNGLAIYRNSRVQSGYPVALMHVPMPAGGHTRESLLDAKAGDMLYWRGHQGIYLGGGKYLHANAKSYAAVVNSLVKGDEEYREDHSVPGAILTWGTAFPSFPDTIVVREFVAVPSESKKGGYRFFVRMNGYAPTTATIYPEGVGEGRPAIVVDNPAQLVGGPMESDNSGAPEYTYSKPGTYYPAVTLTNSSVQPSITATFTMPGLEVRF